jgi:hypothetical protein
MFLLGASKSQPLMPKTLFLNDFRADELIAVDGTRRIDRCNFVAASRTQLPVARDSKLASWAE